MAIDRHKHMLQRYNKERQRNVLATHGDHEFVVVLDNLKAGFNVPKIFRSAEAFGAREVHLVNIGPFDPAPAKGAFRKVPARFHDHFEPCCQDLRRQGYQLFMLEPEGEKALSDCALPQKCAFILGHEEFGLSFDRAEFPEIRSLYIPHLGSVQSLNVSIAASIVMYEYVRQWGKQDA